MIKQPAQPRRVIYGQVRVSGVLSYVSTTNADKTLHLIIACATHEVESFDRFQIDGLTVSTLAANGDILDAKYRKGQTLTGDALVQIKTHTGADNQLADTFLTQRVTEWTSEHRLRGIAYIYFN